MSEKHAKAQVVRRDVCLYAAQAATLQARMPAVKSDEAGSRFDMTPKLHPNTTAKLAITILSAVALKYHYSTASVNDLRWILAPTARLVEHLTGIPFAFESGAGYMSDDNTFLIAASCSGVNFLIIAFLMLTLGKIWADKGNGWLLLPAALMAYVGTIVANTVRIMLALYLRDFDYPILGMSFDEVHRIEGIVVYFGFLLVLFIVSERTQSMFDAVACKSKYLLAIYYAVTLGIPLLRGSYREIGFWQHSVTVILIPLFLISPFVIVGLIRERRVMRVNLP